MVDLKDESNKALSCFDASVEHVCNKSMHESSMHDVKYDSFGAAEQEVQRQPFRKQEQSRHGTSLQEALRRGLQTPLNRPGHRWFGNPCILSQPMSWLHLALLKLQRCCPSP